MNKALDRNHFHEEQPTCRQSNGHGPTGSAVPVAAMLAQ